VGTTALVFIVTGGARKNGCEIHVKGFICISN
jgi:hypothetical protein